MKRQNIDNCKKLRKNQTDTERKLWSILRSRRLEGVKFRRQYPVDKYILDFYAPKHKLGIEVDGGSHYEEKGKQYLSWEPMSVAREYGETIAETKKIQKRFEDCALPMKLCLDVDHGDVMSTNPDDTDPYAWLRAFAKESPLIHLKQSLKDKGGHYPFTPEINVQGKILAEKVIRTLQESGCEETLLLLELSFREREPFDSRILDDVKTSVAYWRQFVKV